MDFCWWHYLWLKDLRQEEVLWVFRWHCQTQGKERENKSDLVKYIVGLMWNGSSFALICFRSKQQTLSKKLSNWVKRGKKPHKKPSKQQQQKTMQKRTHEKTEGQKLNPSRKIYPLYLKCLWIQVQRVALIPPRIIFWLRTHHSFEQETAFYLL